VGLQPKPFGEACCSFWQGGHFVENNKQLTRTASTFSTRREVFLKKKVNVRTTDDFTKSVGARVNYMFPENEKMDAHLAMLFDRNNTADRPWFAASW
jgi:hypothetical protein